MVKDRDFEAEKIQIIRKKIRYPTLLFCLIPIFLLEMGQNQQLPLRYQNKSTNLQSSPPVDIFQLGRDNFYHRNRISCDKA